tara:strand:+ start:20561 stop:21415 length:855 start_codon:yes stop_codon:yes gene_type:complete
MLVSMTGYGKTQVQINNRIIDIEIRSLNSKNLDINIKLGHDFKCLESEFRRLISSKIKRGKIDLNINYENSKAPIHPKINIDIVKNYLSQLKKIDSNNKDLLSIAIKLPEVINSEITSISNKDKKELLLKLQEVINELSIYQLNEGRVLEKEFKKRINALIQLLKNIKKIDPLRIRNIRNKIKDSFNKINLSVDQNRFEQELIYYLEKNDITEERIRLENNLNFFLEELKKKTSSGKKLGFICQEIGREINTIGSKANDANLQKTVIEMKDELEKIKEQLFNIS